MMFSTFSFLMVLIKGATTTDNLLSTISCGFKGASRKDNNLFCPHSFTEQIVPFYFILFTVTLQPFYLKNIYILCKTILWQWNFIMVLADPTQKQPIHWVQAIDHYFWTKEKLDTFFNRVGTREYSNCF